MKPENWAGGGARDQALDSADAAKPFSDADAIFVRRGHLPQPPGGADHKGHDQSKVVEEQDHSLRSGLSAVQSRMIQSSTMKALGTISLSILMLAAPIYARNHEAPPVEPATSFAAVEVHPDEKVAIAAEPYDTKEKESIFRIDYLAHGVMPIRLIVTNNGDKPISLKDARILFQTAAGDRIQAALPEDVQRLMTRKEREGASIPMPGPLGKIKLK